MNHLIAVLAGCATGPEPAAPPPAAEPPIEPSPWTYAGTDGTDAPIDLDAATRAIEAANTLILTYDARDVVAVYDTLRASGDATCPATYPDGYGNEYWADGCTADDGTWFGGYLSDYSYADYYDPSSGLVLSGTSLTGNVQLDGPNGILDLEGGATWFDGVSTDGFLVVVFDSLVGGFWHDRADNWLGEPSAVAVSLTGISIPVFGGRSVTVDGSVGVLVDGEPWSVTYVANTVGNAAAGSQCDQEPGGTISVRDPDGRWVDVTFDGPILDVSDGDPTKCDGCGSSSEGELCADFSDLLAWEAL